jgi:hypothetical protein
MADGSDGRCDREGNLRKALITSILSNGPDGDILIKDGESL